MMNLFGGAGMVMFYPQNNLPMIYIWSSNGVNNGNVTITYESPGVAQNAVQMYNNIMVQGHQITAAMSYHIIPNPGRSVVQRGKINP